MSFMSVSRRGFVTGTSAGLLGTFLATRGIGADTRTITTPFGTYDVPADPRRVVLMGNRFDLEIALALGLKPIAMGVEFTFQGSHNENVAPWVDFDPTGVELFKHDEVTPERILALEPDLILMRGVYPDWYPELAKTLQTIAPAIPTDLLPWREDLTQIAGWLGRESHLAETSAAYDALRDEVKTRNADSLASGSFVFGSVEPPQVWLADTRAKVPAGASLLDLGGKAMTWPEGIADDGSGWAAISPENLGMIGEADGILIWAPTRDVLDEFVSTNPLWARLPNVAAGKALLAPNNVGNGSIYTVMETLRLWDQLLTQIS